MATTMQWHHQTDEPAARVRTMTDDDVPAVVAFGNDVLGDYAGTNVRTVDDFRWRCLDRPGVAKEGARVALSAEGAIVGYVVVRNTGEILDCLVAKGSGAGVSLQLLLDAAERHAVAVGATRLLVNLPVDRRDLRDTAEQAGYAGSAATNLYLGPKDLPALVVALFERSGAGARCDLGFDVRTPVVSEQLNFRLDRGTLSLGDAEDARYRIIAGRGALSSILFSGDSVYRAVLRRELIVKPIIALPMVANVLKRMANRAQWFFNRSDIL